MVTTRSGIKTTYISSSKKQNYPKKGFEFKKFMSLRNILFILYVIITCLYDEMQKSKKQLVKITCNYSPETNNCLFNNNAPAIYNYKEDFVKNNTFIKINQSMIQYITPFKIITINDISGKTIEYKNNSCDSRNNLQFYNYINGYYPIKTMSNTELKYVYNFIVKPNDGIFEVENKTYIKTTTYHTNDIILYTFIGFIGYLLI